MLVYLGRLFTYLTLYYMFLIISSGLYYRKIYLFLDSLNINLFDFIK